jgi:hypothetical protein
VSCPHSRQQCTDEHDLCTIFVLCVQHVTHALGQGVRIPPFANTALWLVVMFLLPGLSAVGQGLGLLMALLLHPLALHCTSSQPVTAANAGANESSANRSMTTSQKMSRASLQALAQE